jgi:transposase
MQTVTTVGLDIAKSVFQVHGVDAAGQVVIRRQLKRRYVLAFFQKLPPCLVGIQACASSHHWSRECVRDRPSDRSRPSRHRRTSATHLPP